jgi:hypothetical protein
MNNTLSLSLISLTNLELKMRTPSSTSNAFTTLNTPFSSNLISFKWRDLKNCSSFNYIKVL